MKKFTKILIIVLLITFAFLVNQNQIAYAKQAQAKKTSAQLNILVLGDSIAAGFVPESLSAESFYTDYQNYLNSTTSYTHNSFPEIVASRYEGVFGKQNIYIKSKAVSGYNTNQLLQLLNEEDLKNDIKNSDIVLMSVGANNILVPMLNALPDYISDNITLQEITQTLDAGVSNFFDDIDKIMKDITNLNPEIAIFPMTVYSPYKYADLNEIKIFVEGTDTTNLVATYLESINEKLQTINNLSMEKLSLINNYYLKNDFSKNSSNQIIPIDVKSVFETLTKQEYSQMLNVDTSSMIIELTAMEAFQITFMGNYSILNDVLVNNSKLDPHPTKQGHKKIGEIYNNTLTDIYLTSNKNLENNLSEIQNFELSYQAITNQNLNYFLEKITANRQEKVASLNSNKINLKAENFVGKGKFVVVAYNKDNNIISTSNEIDYNIIDDRVKETVAIFANKTSGNISQNQTLAITVSYSSNHTPNFKAFKVANGTETELPFTLSGQTLLIDTSNIVGENVTFYIQSFNNQTLLATSEKITLNFSSPANNPDKEIPPIIISPTDNNYSIILYIIGGIFAFIFIMIFLSMLKKSKYKRM